MAAGACGRSDERTFSSVEQAVSIAFVQLNYATPQSSVSTVSVPFKATQSAGNLNVVVVGWNDTTSRVSSVTDTKGNAYQLAVGPAAVPGALTQSIYYAKNIVAAAAGANTVRVSFTAAALYPDIRILEYGGMDQLSPVDVTASATGSTSTSSTPPVATTTSPDLLFAANTVATWTRGAGSGWTNRVITTPDGDIAEDRIVSTAGSYGSSAPLGGPGPWVMQMVAFKQTASAPPPPPTAPTNLAATAASSSQINLSWTNTSSTQTGVKVERSTDNVSFTQIAVAGATAVSYPDSGLSASATYYYRVRATNASGDSPYSNTASATTQSPPPPPTAPTNLAATAASSSQINLSWTNTSSTQTGVKIERSTDNVSFTQIAVAGATAVSYPDSGLSASTTYYYQVRATNPSGDSPYSNTASATTSQFVTPPRPALVQNLSTYTNRDGEAGNDFIVNLPTPTLANNCLILALTNAYSPTRTILVSDDKSNTWTAGPHVDFVANNETTTIFYALGVAGGSQKITIHFDASIYDVHATVSEWTNIATAAAANGSSGASDVASPVSAGSFTPGNNDANGGNLIYQHAIAIPGVGALGNLTSTVSGVTAGAGFTLASANRQLASISQYTIQTTAAAINPTLTVTQGSGTDHFNTIAIAFKAAAAGTAPASGIRIQNMQHTFHPWPGSSTVNLPSSGNLLALTAPVNTGQDAITSVRDSKGNAWTKVAGESLDSPQVWYAVNATPGSDLTISFNVANNTGIIVIAWDIAGASTAPFDKFTEATGAQAHAGDDITNAPLITPSTAHGLVIGLVNEYTGPPTSMIGAGYVADHVYYAGETDSSLMDMGDGTAHIYNSDTSQLSFGWHQTSHPPTSGWFAIAVAFKSGP
ncbi:MAG: hypothetical protein AUI48_10590 [Chloroflexi bacterium 13_1_40CM_2_68_14]|nr:MAG: hypothetical protein AUI48_10590 [Chloroflexi bacterium 13_1_40CM_2_68_14]